MSTQQPNFDRGKPFYPLVMNYAVLLAGWRELAAMGVPGIERHFGISVDASGARETGPDLERDLRKLLKPLELKCETHAEAVRVDSQELANELAANHVYVLSFLLRAAGSLLILAHETCREHPCHDTGELWEFLRHCRNAAAHGGRFSFKHGEPRRAARWRGLEMTDSLQGIALLKDDAGAGLLSPGDPIRLLWDIEQAFPGMVA